MENVSEDPSTEVTEPSSASPLGQTRWTQGGVLQGRLRHAFCNLQSNPPASHPVWTEESGISHDCAALIALLLPIARAGGENALLHPRSPAR